MNNRAKGAVYEDKAAGELRRLGYNILTKNFYCRGGELDIVATDGEYLCFVEVKYRASTSDGDPLEAVDHTKIKRICRSALFYMNRFGYPEDTPVRFDVVSILGDEISVFKNAFDYE